MIRPCRPEERPAILSIINAAAEAYRGRIPADCWHEPYMSAAELDAAVASGVSFQGYEDTGELIGVMGIQPVKDVDLIRHAYVKPGRQKGGAGSALLGNFNRSTTRPILIGTWAAADWAIRFYEKHGFTLVGAVKKDELLAAYWSIPPRQAAASVVLANRLY